MKKSLFVSCLSSLLLLATLAGCSGGGRGVKPNFEIPEGGYDGSEVTIKIGRAHV